MTDATPTATPRIPYPVTDFSRCADSTSRFGGVSPWMAARPGFVLARNRRSPAAGRAPIGGVGRWPAITQTHGGFLPSWKWLRYPPPDLVCLGRPLVVRRGDVLHIGSHGSQPQMVFVVLRELIPVDDESALHVDGFEVDERLRVIRRLQVYLRRPDGIAAQVPTRWVGHFASEDYGLESGGL